MRVDYLAGIVFCREMLITVVKWLESHMLECGFKKLTGYDCPGCGLQRSVVALLKGDLVESFLLFPALIPILSMLVILPLHLKYSFKHGASTLQWTFIFAVVLMLGNCLIKNFA